MQSFTFHCPTEIVFGRGAENAVAEKLRAFGASRVLILYGGGSAERSGLLSRIEKNLTSAGLAFLVMGGVRPNPRVSFVREAIREGIAADVNFVLAVGGGSVIDSAKAVAHGIVNPTVDIWDIWTHKAELTKTMPFGSVLTIPAAGSETSDSAVLTNEDTGRKIGLNTQLNRPVIAFMNPELAFTLPREQIAAGAADIMMHTMERYFTSIKETNLFTDRIAEQLLLTVMESVKRLLVSRKDYDAMSELMWAGSVSHSGLTELGRRKDFSVHKLGHELSARYDATHAMTLTALWGSWARHVYHDDAARFAHFAAAIFGIDAGTDEERARAGIRKMEEFFTEIGMPTSLAGLGVGALTKGAIEEIASAATANDTIRLGDFRPLTRADAIAIYERANGSTENYR
ncbi:putative NADH-dependent butanol dehydrogenase A [Selenomonas sp. FOBRC6]|uniref:iron-containing alcohol dehydrogenase n=1 Tax=Selenomonas sp. FOBRC6 TaxID=936572 RepID=UPI000277F589|nr:iron-containing alcohol dehydrogenase [Selenomonas sp. FOBRC6]EJO20917.1 putative NADH-dependent butanol dehydrogenase A [Selenomonas sp. FOBRC6]